MARFALSCLIALLVTGGAGSALAQGFDGQWTGSIRCSWGSGTLDLTIAGGKVTGNTINAPITSGTVSGGRVSFTSVNFLNTTTFTGSASGGQMQGTYTQNLSSETCQWQATRVGGPAATPKPTAPEAEVGCGVTAGVPIPEACADEWGKSKSCYCLPLTNTCRSTRMQATWNHQFGGKSTRRSVRIDPGRTNREACTGKAGDRVEYLFAKPMK